MEIPVRTKLSSEIADPAFIETLMAQIYRYLKSSRERAVFPTNHAIEGLDIFSEPMPAQPVDTLSICRQLDRAGSPATVMTTGGRYFGLVVGGVLPAALAARLLTDVWDQNAGLYKMSPISAKLESVVEDWLKDIFKLPEESCAGFVSGTSTATMVGLVAARYRLLERQGWDVNKQGLSGAPDLRVVASRDTHGTVPKALSLLGLGTDNIEWVDVDAQGRIRVEGLPVLDERTILILQAGNVNSGAFDDFETLCARANESGAWVHIDGAFGLWAAAADKLSYLTNGIEDAQSWSLDGHKTLNTPYDNGVVLCRDRDALVNALHASGDYIVYSDARDGMLFTPEMSRRARANEMWAALKFLGRGGLDDLIQGFHDRAVQFRDELIDAGFEILNDVVFNQVLVGCDSEEESTALISHIQNSGECWVGGSRWKGEPVIRISVCSWATTKEDVTRSVAAFARARQAIRR